jgi:hypothetical protein
MATKKMAGGAVVEGLNETLKALNRLDADGKKAVKDETQKVANLLAREVARAGVQTGDRRNAHVASTVRGTRERTPTIKIGSAKRMSTQRRGQGPRASDLMYGMEFGSSGTGAKAVDKPTVRGGAPGWRFPERTPKLGRGNRGNWIYPTIRSQQANVVVLWAAALEKAVRRAGD